MHPCFFLERVLTGLLLNRVQWQFLFPIYVIARTLFSGCILTSCTIGQCLFLFYFPMNLQTFLDKGFLNSGCLLKAEKCVSLWPYACITWCQCWHPVFGLNISPCPNTHALIDIMQQYFFMVLYSLVGIIPTAVSLVATVSGYPQISFSAFCTGHPAWWNHILLCSIPLKEKLKENVENGLSLPWSHSIVLLLISVHKHTWWFN